MYPLFLLPGTRITFLMAKRLEKLPQGLRKAICLWRRCKTKRTTRCSGGNLQRSRKPHSRGWESPGFTHGEDANVIHVSALRNLLSTMCSYDVKSPIYCTPCSYKCGAYCSSISRGVKAIRADSDEIYHVDEMQRRAVRCSIICAENGPSLLA